VSQMREPLIPFEQAIDRVLAEVQPLPARSVPLREAAGCFCAQSVVAPEPVPAFSISAMDGYAIPRAILDRIQQAGRAEARVVGEVAAGRPGFEEPPGPDEVIRIFTGGVVPSWAAAVVMQENAHRDGDRVTLQGPVKERAYIRDAGSDIRRGDEVLAAGTLITPPVLGVLASLGVGQVLARPRPRVGIVITGSELVSNAEPAHGKIRDSNGPTLEAAALCCGAGSVRRTVVPDDPPSVRAAVASLLDDVDLLITSGGVSVGDYDLMRDLLEAIGFERILWRVAQRPGKPLYAAKREGLLVLGLPGNPASALATFLCHGWPVLRRLQGASQERVRLSAVVAAAVRKAPGFTAMLRARRFQRGATLCVESAGPQESHQMLPFARADCLILGPPDREVLDPGLEVQVVPFPWV